MELNDPLIESVLIHMYLHPEGIDLRELVGEDQSEEVLECLSRTVWSGESNEIVYGGFLP